MRVAIIINTSWNIYNFREGLVRNFLNNGDEVIAIAPHDGYSSKLEDWGCQYFPAEVEGTGMNPAGDFRFFLRLRKILKQTKPDVVLTYTIKPNLYGSLASGLMGIPCICNVSGLGTVFLWKGIIRLMAVMLYRFTFRFNKWIFFQNDEDQKEFLEMVDCCKHKTSLLPGSGINTEKFKFSGIKHTDKKVFLMISRLIVEKGVRDYIEAIKLVKAKRDDVEFRLVGALDTAHARSVDQSELDSWISQGLITYKPHQENIIPEIEESDVVVLPSYREGTPRTLLEAGAMGKALIATDVPGCRHIVEHGYNGFLASVKDPKDLADKMLEYLDLNMTDQKEMADNSRKRVEEVFDEQKVISLYSEKIAELLK